jgi:hypothetical protein
VRGPGGWTTSPIVNSETAVLRDPATKLSQPVHCTCPGVWCRGRDSADWLSCQASCRACNPPRRRRRPAPGLDVQLDQES